MSSSLSRRPSALADIADVTKMIAGIAAIKTADPEQIDRIVAMALDGLRVR